MALLLAAGADRSARLSANSNQCVSGLIYPAGSTPASIAAQGGYDGVLELLRD